MNSETNELGEPADESDQLRGAEDDAPQQPSRSKDATKLWALSPTHRMLHWATIPLLMALAGFAITQLARHGPGSAAWVFVLVPLLLVVQVLRAVVAVWLDPVDGDLILFRAAGGALRTRVRQVRRLDHGALAATWRYPGHDQRPIRIVTDHGTATLSVFFPDPYDLATTLRDTNLELHIDL